MFQTDRTIERQLFAFTHRDLVSEDSDVWLYMDLFDDLDLSDFDSSYCAQGQAAKEPKLMLRTLFYALTHGIISGRKLQEVCRNDNRYVVLSGNTRPDRRTFDRFIKKHKSAFTVLFKKIVHLAQEMGLVTLGRVAIDGSKFKAFAGKNMRYDAMCRALDHIGENLLKLKDDLAKANSSELNGDPDQLKAEIKDQTARRDLIKQAKERIERDIAAQQVKECKKRKRQQSAVRAIHDLDALTVGRNCNFPFGYNLQAAVDDESQIIVAAEIHENQSDQGALAKMMDKVKENCGEYPAKTLADCGYNSLKNIGEVEARNSEAIIPLDVEYKNYQEQACEQIRKGNGDREYFCLNNRKLHLATRLKTGHLSFKLQPDFCVNCPYATRCRLNGKQNVQILDDAPREKFIKHARKTRAEDFKEDYRWRKAIVEPVFGNIKNKGLRIFIRGNEAVANWWNIVTTAHNIEKILRETLCIRPSAVSTFAFS